MYIIDQTVYNTLQLKICIHLRHALSVYIKAGVRFVALCVHTGICVIVDLIPFTITTTTSASICRLNVTL